MNSDASFAAKLKLFDDISDLVFRAQTSEHVDSDVDQLADFRAYLARDTAEPPQDTDSVSVCGSNDGSDGSSSTFGSEWDVVDASDSADDATGQNVDTTENVDTSQNTDTSSASPKAGGQYETFEDREAKVEALIATLDRKKQELRTLFTYFTGKRHAHYVKMGIYAQALREDLNESKERIAEAQENNARLLESQQADHQYRERLLVSALVAHRAEIDRKIKRLGRLTFLEKEILRNIDPSIASGDIRFSATRYYGCSSCKTELVKESDVLDKDYVAAGGKGYFSRNVRNIGLGPQRQTKMISGVYCVQDVTCSSCHVVIGWKYIDAGSSHAKNQHKVGRYVIEQRRLLPCFEVTMEQE